ncbi:MAG TPA: phospholipid carrier-dependent glycosyltransferase [Micromonosporaceae bacterium]
MDVQVTVERQPADQPKRAGGAGRLGEIPAAIRRRLEPMAGGGWRAWSVAAWVVLIASALRFVKLGFPPSLVFDEVYYAREGQQMLDHGVEWRYEYDDQGNITADDGPDYVVHPPLGKWIIALGIKISRDWFHDAPVIPTVSSGSFGWRLMPAVFGVLSILIVTRTARRMFRSTVLGATAGLLMALDGMEMVLSRTAILDIFVLFFAIAAFACLVLDRDQRRARWLREMENGLDPTAPGPAGRPRFGWGAVPWWRLAAGVMLGLGCGVKWSIVFYIPVFAALVYLWEANLRRTVGAAHPWRDALLDEVGWIAALGALAAASYLSTWSAWFASDDGYKRHFLRDQGQPEPFIIGALRNLWSYQSDVLKFHTGLDSPHPYQSWPWQWLLLGRPVAFFWAPNPPPCGASSCASEIVLLGTPVLWWAFIPALLAMIWFGISRRDWRPLAIGVGAAAGILPWFYYEIADNRTMYYFYAAPAEPFLVLAVVYVLGCLITGPGVGRYGGGRVRLGLALSVEERRLYGTIAAAAFVLLVAICFWIYYPLYVGDSIPHDDWWRRMLLGNRWV